MLKILYNGISFRNLVSCRPSLRQTGQLWRIGQEWTVCVISVRRHSLKLEIWRGIVSPILGKSHTSVEPVRRHSLKLDIWGDIFLPIMGKSHTHVELVRRHSLELENWKCIWSLMERKSHKTKQRQLTGFKISWQNIVGQAAIFQYRYQLLLGHLE